MYFSREHLFPKILQNQAFNSGDLGHFTTRILVKQKHLLLESSGIIITIQYHIANMLYSGAQHQQACDKYNYTAV